MSRMTTQRFINKWQGNTLTERSAYQQHFLDLCELFEIEKPAAVDQTGESFTFEKHVEKRFGGKGYADVWRRGFFAFEYKGHHKNLEAAYKQLVDYLPALENPPLLVVCDTFRIVIHTNFTNTPYKRHDILLEQMAEPRNWEVLRALFHDPAKLRPGAPSETATREAARHLAEIAQKLRSRSLEPIEVAKFLDRVVFCLFAEDVGLLEPRIVKSIIDHSDHQPERFRQRIALLFEQMARGGSYGPFNIRHFNGDLFTDCPVPLLSWPEIKMIEAAAKMDWSQIDPSIFGTLFERALDPKTRAKLGAQYTSREDIETVLEPVVMTPLRREWEETRALAANLLETGKKNPTEADRKKPLSKKAQEKAREEVAAFLTQFLDRLTGVKILDPACGSGNFLYVALQRLKDLELEVLQHAQDKLGKAGLFLPRVGPWQLHGIEINAYAFELAQLSVWIGYLQWTTVNGFSILDTPVLRKMDTFRNGDAILVQDADGKWHEPDWPRVDFIIGNPPFLGNRLHHAKLGKEYSDHLYEVYGERLEGKPDLCCYWFEQARRHIEMGKAKRAGLLATQAIRGGTNRRVLELIKKSGDIFMAVPDKAWVLDGANVNISIAGFDDGSEKKRQIAIEKIEGSEDGWKTRLFWRDCVSINPNLTAGEADISLARKIKENANLSFQGTIKRGKFDVPESMALEWLILGGNPNGQPNSDVLIPYMNAMDLTRGNRCQWVIDFGKMPKADASMYETPYNYAAKAVRPDREKAKQAEARERWWQHWNDRSEMFTVLKPLNRFIVTPTVSKHRLFARVAPPTNPDHQLIVFAREDDYFFGLLHSHAHELWALKLGTRLQTRPRYTPTTCFETFPMPRPSEEQERAIAEAARELDTKRTAWLNPAELVKEAVVAEFRASNDGPWARLVERPGKDGIGTVRLKRMVPRDEAAAKELKKRTLTNLYNARPEWLDGLHRTLDAAVLAAYGWPADITDDDLLARLLALNLERAGG